MQCSRKGCENIMCDICIPCIGYICYGCKNEFRFYLESNGLNPTTEEEITKELKSFILTIKDSFSEGTKITVDDFFNKNDRNR